MKELKFEWDRKKNRLNEAKHSISFKEARKAFFDPHAVFAEDEEHSQHENRKHCIGKIKEKIVTVRFTMRDNKIRIIGAGYWRKGKRIYEKENYS